MARTLNPTFASTEQVAEAAGGVTRHTLRRWCDKGVLPEPTRIGVARAGTHNRWPEWAVARAAWVRQMLDEGFTLDEVADRVRPLGDSPTPAAPALRAKSEE
jgi:DNA-binding transcriptional MerR regulator